MPIALAVACVSYARGEHYTVWNWRADWSAPIILEGETTLASRIEKQGDELA